MFESDSTSESSAGNAGGENEVDSFQQNIVEQQPRTQASWGLIWENLLRLGLGEFALRLGTGITSIILVLLVVWVMNNFYLKGQLNGPRESALAAPLPTATNAILQAPLDLSVVMPGNQGIHRLAQLHTTFPARPRYDITQYEVQKGDTIFGIAEKYNLKPETVLWGNYYILADDPHRLKPGMILEILPINGVYHKWSAGEGLNGVSKYYGVDPQVIIEWPGNQLSAETIGDFANPNIEPGKMLVVPGGQREFISWSAPRITRQDPAVAKIFGPGACGQVMDGPIGTGTFVYPTLEHILSGYDFSPETNHFGLDFAGNTGNAIFASDSGVVVYAGWNDWGYGNVVVIDHGNGWQTLYGHLSSYTVECGSYAYQGDLIGGMGSTGNSSGAHLHFEMRSDEYGKVNPWNFIR